MLVIVDANVVISALITYGTPLRIFEANAVERDLEFIAPEQLYIEIQKNLEKILKASKHGEDEFEEVYKFIISQIEVIPYEAFKDKLEEAKVIAPHMEDEPYIALALKFGAIILTGDKALTKALPSKAISPSEAYAILTGP